MFFSLGIKTKNTPTVWKYFIRQRSTLEQKTSFYDLVEDESSKNGLRALSERLNESVRTAKQCYDQRILQHYINHNCVKTITR